MQPCLTNAAGGPMPDIGFGTYQCGDGAAAAAQVEAVVRCGYRLLDTAASY